MPATRAQKRKVDSLFQVNEKKIKDMEREKLPEDCMTPFLYLQSEDLKEDGFQKFLTKHRAFFHTFPLVILRKIPLQK